MLTGTGRWQRFGVQPSEGDSSPHDKREFLHQNHKSPGDPCHICGNIDIMVLETTYQSKALSFDKITA
jgi:hypothetical protein